MNSAFTPLQRCHTILVAGATADNQLRHIGTVLRREYPDAQLILLRPNRIDAFPAHEYDRVIAGTSSDLHPDDLLPIASDATVLAISHVTRPAYPSLIRCMCSREQQTMIWTANGLQPVDLRDSQTDWPEPIIPNPSCTAQAYEQQHIAFFRASDQSVKTLAQQRKDAGSVIHFVDTVKALENILREIDTVFFDWCLTDYSILFPAFQLAVSAQKRLEAFVALDLTDVAEVDSVCRLLTYLNRSALPQLHRVYVLSTRSFIAERYGLNPDRVTPLGNLPDEIVWHAGYKSEQKDEIIRFVYHGLMYFWHELAEFLPIFEAVQDIAPAQFDIYGRPHESVSCGTISLFPHAEQTVQQKLKKLHIMPGVTMHGFTAPAKTAQAVSSADFYVGITAAQTLMAQTEMRTGVIEAMRTGCRILHKDTQGITDAGFRAGKDYLCVDASTPEEAAKAIVAEFERSR